MHGELTSMHGVMRSWVLLVVMASGMTTRLTFGSEQSGLEVFERFTDKEGVVRLVLMPSDTPIFDAAVFW